MVNGILNNINIRGGATAIALATAFVTRVEEDGGVVESQSCLTDRIANLKDLGLWNKASAVWLPHGYKEGKLYAAKGGSAADLTITRAGTRTRKGPTYVEQVPYNRIRASQGSFNHSGYWVKLGGTTTVIDNIETAPNGTLTASLITNGLAGSGHGLRGTSNIIGDVPVGDIYTVSFWAKGSGVKILVDISDDNPTPTTLTSEWQRYTYSIAVSSSSLFVDIVFGVGSALNDQFYLWGVQLVRGTEALDYFPTNDRFHVPALDYTNDTCPALSLEPARTNLLLHSESFDNASWTKSNVTPTANNAIAPDGLSTADTILETTANNVHAVLQSITKSASATQYAYSIHVKGVGRTWIALEGYNGVNGFTKYFDLTNVVVGSTVSAGAGFTLNSSSIVALEDEEGVPTGWYRCVVVFTTDATTALTVDCLSATADGTKSFIGDVTKGFIPWGAQLEAGSYATSYIPTTTGSVMRIADAVDTLIPRRTNIVKNSSDYTQTTWIKTGTSVAGTSLLDPLGGTTGSEILAASSGPAQHNVGATVSFVPGSVTYVWSAYLKYINHRYVQLPLGGIGSAIPSYVNVDLLNGVITQQDSKNVAAISAEANGWYRVSVQMIATNGGTISTPIAFIDGPTAARSANSTTTGVEKFGLWGAQCEVGSLTALLQTTTGPTHDGSVIGLTEGTIYFEGRSSNTAVYRGILFIGDGTINYRLGVSFSNSNKLQAGIVHAGTTAGDGGIIETADAIPDGHTVKMCFTYGPDYAALFVDGVKIGEDLTMAVPANMGMISMATVPGANTNPFHGEGDIWLLSPTIISDAEAIALTTP